MYVSDYLYAAIDDYWSKSGFSVSGENYDYRSATNNDWLYLGASEWTISRNTNDSNEVFHIHSLGYVGQNGVNYNSFVARPCFYLTSSTTYVSGPGTSSDPIRTN